ncbi:MAG: hypothetical protein RLZZ338_2051 [Cyanobacteriota bacterium]
MPELGGLTCDTRQRARRRAPPKAAIPSQLINFPPAQTRANKSNGNPRSNEKGNADPASLCCPFHKLFALAFGKGKPREDRLFFTVFFAQCFFSSFGIAHSFFVTRLLNFTLSYRRLFVKDKKYNAGQI